MNIQKNVAMKIKPTTGKISMNTTSEIAEIIAAAVVGKIPYVGGLLSGITKAFWPASGPDLWAQIKSQVEALVEQDIATYNLQQLQLTLQGLQDEVNNYIQLTDPEQKLAALESIDNNVVLNLPKFLSGGPASGFSCFWGMALLHLSIRRELCHLVGDAANQQLLAESVETYCAFGRVGLSRIYNERLAQIEVTSSSNNVPGKNSMWAVNVNMTDNKTGAILFQYNKMYRNGWGPAVLVKDTIYCNEQIAQQWTDLTGSLQSELGGWACDAIIQMEAKYPYTQTDALAKLQNAMDSTEYSQYTDNYYPTSSIYNAPQTNQPLQPTPARPTVRLNR